MSEKNKIIYIIIISAVILSVIIVLIYTIFQRNVVVPRNQKQWDDAPRAWSDDKIKTIRNQIKNFLIRSETGLSENLINKISNCTSLKFATSFPQYINVEQIMLSISRGGNMSSDMWLDYSQCLKSFWNEISKELNCSSDSSEIENYLGRKNFGSFLHKYNNLCKKIF